ncbi:hypothetical protein Rrhod_0152 [Rhodococcus rhodnii LMG 5362]|uniref:Uncharacterized protein n=1 Tax=Rhodococcus rhodnii LMG 5362 TaxID=1273125 RepID=R7WW17_9NOCA|nr:hypothetical protein Rrhod_0152 [Rhodococcus rhodnii LMG 5362]
MRGSETSGEESALSRWTSTLNSARPGTCCYGSATRCSDLLACGYEALGDTWAKT